MDRVKLIASLLKANLYPDEKDIARYNAKFDKISKGEDFIFLDDYEKAVKDEIFAENSRYSSLEQEHKDKIVFRRVNVLKKRDENEDGKLSRTEYIHGEFYNKLDAVLSGVGDGYDGKMTNTEILHFLREWCFGEKDSEAVTKAFGGEVGSDTNGISTSDVHNGLFELICPPASARLEELVQRIKDTFTLSGDEKDDCVLKFQKFSGCDKDSVTIVQFRKTLREHFKGMNFNEESRTSLRKLVDKRTQSFHDMDRNKDGKITMNEYLANASFIKLLSSMLEYDCNGDQVADRSELIAWVKEKLKLTEDTEDYVDAVSQEFLDAGVVQGKALVNGLFNLAFPTDGARVKDVVEAVRRKFAPSEERKAQVEADFKELCGDKDFIEIEPTYREMTRDELSQEYKDMGMKKAMYQSMVDAVLATKMDWINKIDRSKDGRVSATEYLLSKVYDDLLNSLMGDADGEDGKLDKGEMVKWLQGRLGQRRDLEGVATALMGTFKDADEEEELDTWNFADRLFAAAFPPDEVLVQRVVEAIRTNFALSQDEKKKLLIKFKELAGEEETMTKEQANKQAEEDIRAKYKPDVVDVLLEKRLDGITKADVNEDRKITADEWLRNQLFEKIFFSLHAADSNGNLVLERSEFIKWLAENCLLSGEMYADACIGTFLNCHDNAVRINDLMEPLFDLVCPTPEMRMKRVAEGLVKVFGGKESEMRKSLRKCAQIAKRDGVTVDELTDWLEADCGMPEEAEENVQAIFGFVCPNGENTAKPAAIIDALVGKIIGTF